MLDLEYLDVNAPFEENDEDSDGEKSDRGLGSVSVSGGRD